jgi:hypothetical protein
MIRFIPLSLSLSLSIFLSSAPTHQSNAPPHTTKGRDNRRLFGAPSIVHFVGVPKPSDIFPSAQRRSTILNGLQPAFVS